MNHRKMLLAGLITLMPFCLLGASKREKDKTKREERKKKVEEPKKFVSNMDLSDLRKRKNDLIVSGSKDLAIKCLEKMIPLCTDVQELGVLMLEYADLLFDTGDLAKAGALFEQFVLLYPGNNKVEYASYKSILCSFYALLSTDRDQTKTKQTVALAQQFLNRSSVFREYAGQVQGILTTCHEKLLESELNIVSFYIKRGSYNAASVRLACIEEELNSSIPNLKPRLLTIECDMALQLNNTQMLNEKRLILARDFPDFVKAENAKIAANQPKKVDFVTRF